MADRRRDILTGPSGSGEAELSLASSALSLDRVQSTPENVVAELFRTLRVPVYRYLLVAFNNAKDAEDVMQETFLQLFRTLKRGERVDHPRAWVFRVAHNLAVNQASRSRFVSDLDESAWYALCAVQPDPSPDPEQHMLARERQRLLERGMVRLSRQQRRCALLRMEGLRHREIADVFGVSSSTVAECMRRALSKLTRSLHD